ncbi:MAG TPA: hypothetical protein VKV04_04405 [Verrucomicrobiae bacterium]|nr:hypothetical protein [Verrucomicrobiae bacterium]
MGAKAPSGSKNYYGHCAGIVCQGQLDFISGLLINNELVFPNAAIWDSQIFHKNRIIIYTDGNAYQTNIESNEVPPNFPWQIIAFAWISGGAGYSTGDKVVSGGFVFQSLTNSNTTTPPATATSNANWKYLYTPTQWTSISTSHLWSAGSVVAWEGQVYQTAADTNEEPPNAPWVPFQILRSASPNPLKMTVPKNTRFGQNAGPGDWYLYWGTPNQVLDASGEEVLTGLGHPPYRNCAVIVGKSILFGTQTVNPPSVQVLGGRAPVQSIITGPAAALDADWQANPWCVLAEMLTHPIYGLGLPTNWFDSPTWNAEANRCYANPSLFYISPIYTSLKRVSELVADLVGYPDAFIFWSTIATLMAGHWPHGEAPPTFVVGNTINRDNIIKEFSSSSEGWWGTANSVAVSIQDLQAGFKSRPCLAPNLFNMAVTRRLLTQKIDRPFITRYSQGLAWATEFAKIAGDQTSNGTIEVQAEKCATTQPGSLFLLTDDQFGTSEVQRCTRKVISAPPTGTAKITHETERGVAPQPYSPTQTNPVQATGPSPALVTNYAVAQLPTAMTGESNTLAVLAGRESGPTSQLQVWFRQADGAAFQQLGTNTAFAVAGWFDIALNSDELYSSDEAPIQRMRLGQVTQGNTYNIGDTQFWQYQVWYSVPATPYFPATLAVEGTDYSLDPIAGTITVLAGGSIATNDYLEVDVWNTVPMAYDPNTPASDVDAISAALTQDEINDNDLLLFAFQANNPALFEIMSVRSVQAVGTNASGGPLNGYPVLFLKVYRAQFGTQPGGDGSYIWGTNPADQIFVTPRASVTALSNLAFPGLAGSASSATFILAPESAWVTAEISDIYDVANNPGGLSTEFIYTFADLYGPTVTWISEQNQPSSGSFSDISSYSGSFLTTDTFYFTFQLNTSTGANIVAATLTATLGTQQLTLWSQTFNSPVPDPVSVQFQLPAGLWSLSVNVRCDDGTQTDAPLTLVGSATAVTVQVNAPSPPTAPSPIIDTYNQSGSTISDLKFGPLPTGLTVLYQTVTYGAAYNPSGWHTASSLGGGIYGTVPNFTKPKYLYAKCQQSGVADSPVTLFAFSNIKRL